MSFCVSQSFIFKDLTFVSKCNIIQYDEIEKQMLTLVCFDSHMIRKNCPSAYAFTYLYCCDGATNDRIEAMCLLCHSRYHEPSLFTMEKHHMHCIKGKPPIDVESLLASSNADATSNEVEYVSEYGVTKREVDGQRRLPHNIYPPGYRIKMISTSKGLRKHSECLICNEQKRKPVQTYFETHR